MTSKLELDDRIPIYKNKNARVTVKDHKPDFQCNPKYRLINPASTHLGKISRHILAKANKEARQKLNVNQWTSTQSAIKWFTELDSKEKRFFVKLDINSFYPSISESLLLESIEFIGKITTISKEEKDIILLSRKSLLFHDEKVWVKRKGNLYSMSEWDRKMVQK